MTAMHPRNYVRESVKSGVWLYVEIALWMVALSAVGSGVARVFGL
jgi:hypothetical protein